MHELLRKDTYISSILPESDRELRRLQHQMAYYYASAPYPREIRALTSNWHEHAHKAQITLCTLIPPGSRVLEVGCGNGSSMREIKQRTENITYIGCDLSHKEWAGLDTSTLTVMSADRLSLPSASFDVVLSMYVIEHLVFPACFLNECWRVLKPGGRLLIIAPDLSSQGMASERIGFSYGPGRYKLRHGRILDVLLTTYDSRVRIPRLRAQRMRRIRAGYCDFPVLTRPRCLDLPGFVPDCDAVYPSCSAEIMAYMRHKHDCEAATEFYHDPSTLALCWLKGAWMGLHNTDVLIRAVILIPAYNSAATIQAALGSIQKQAQGLERIAAVYLADDSPPMQR
jgi:SAM-dependent methyltransferase